MRVDQVNKLMWVACLSEVYSPILFGLAGSICDCGMSIPRTGENADCPLRFIQGIKTVQEIARKCREIVQLTGMHQPFKRRGWNAEHSLEFCTRCLVREKYDEIFGANATQPTIRALWDVLDRIYPCSAD